MLGNCWPHSHWLPFHWQLFASCENCVRVDHQSFSELIFNANRSHWLTAGEVQPCQEGKAAEDESCSRHPLQGAKVSQSPIQFLNQASVLDSDHSAPAGCLLHIHCIVCVSLGTTAWTPALPCETTLTLSPGNSTWPASRRTRRPSGDPKLEPKPGTGHSSCIWKDSGWVGLRITAPVTCCLCRSGGISSNLQEKRKKYQNKRKNQSGEPPQFKEVPCKKFRQVSRRRRFYWQVVMSLTKDLREIQL